MKYQEVKKLLGLTIAASALSLSACANKEVEAPAPTVVETPAPTEAPIPTPAPAVEEIEVIYENSATETDVLEIVDNQPVGYVVKDYEPLVFFDTLLDADFPFSYNAEDNTLLLNDAVCSAYCEIADTLPNDGEPTEEESPAEAEETEAPKSRYLLVREVDLGASLGEYTKPVVKYLKTGDNEATALYIGTTTDETESSGITFVFSMTEDNAISLEGILGIFDEDLSTLKVYEGPFGGYRLTPDGEVVYQAGDEILANDNVTFYPIFDYGTDTEKEVIDGFDVISISKGANGLYYLTGVDGSITVINPSTGKPIASEKVKDTQDNKTKKDKTGGNGDGGSSDGSKSKPEDSGDGGYVDHDTSADDAAAIAGWAAMGAEYHDGPIQQGSYNIHDAGLWQ